MEKIKNFLLSVNFNVLIFTLIGIRIAVMGASIGEALSLLSVCCLLGFVSWLESRKEIPLSETVLKEIEEIKSNVSGLVIKNTYKPASQQDLSSKRLF